MGGLCIRPAPPTVPHVDAPIEHRRAAALGATWRELLPKAARRVHPSRAEVICRREGTGQVDMLSFQSLGILWIGVRAVLLEGKFSVSG